MRWSTRVVLALFLLMMTNTAFAGCATHIGRYEIEFTGGFHSLAVMDIQATDKETYSINVSLNENDSKGGNIVETLEIKGSTTCNAGVFELTLRPLQKSSDDIKVLTASFVINMAPKVVKPFGYWEMKIANRNAKKIAPLFGIFWIKKLTLTEVLPNA